MASSVSPKAGVDSADTAVVTPMSRCVRGAPGQATARAAWLRYDVELLIFTAGHLLNRSDGTVTEG
jgi:hypothetical protein